MVFGDLLVTGATWTLALGAAWAVLICAAAVAEVLSDGRLALTSRLGCPASARRALLAGLGVVLASGGAVAAGPVSAAPAPFDSSRTGQRDEQRDGPLSGLSVPARPTGSAHTVPPQQVEVEVQPGDCLWRLSQARAPARASMPDVARTVARTYRANRDVIGPDPDLIHPGQQLRIPHQRRDDPNEPAHRWETP